MSANMDSIRNWKCNMKKRKPGIIRLTFKGGRENAKDFNDNIDIKLNFLS